MYNGDVDRFRDSVLDDDENDVVQNGNDEGSEEKKENGKKTKKSDLKHIELYPMGNADEQLPERTTSELESLLTAGWRERHPADFNYPWDSNVQTTLLMLPYFRYGSAPAVSMIKQRSAQRAGKRTPGKLIESVELQLEKDAFHFLKVKQREAIYVLSRDDLEARTPLADLNEEPTGDHIVFINVNPSAPYHFLLNMHAGELLPQILTHEALASGLKFASQFGDNLRLMYNSAGAGSSVNHLHWQGIFLWQPFPVEHVPLEFKTLRFEGMSGGEARMANLVKSEKWPISALVFDLSEYDSAGENFAHDMNFVASLIIRVVQSLIENNIPHNIMVRNGGSPRVYLFARDFENSQSIDPSDLQVAGQEACGHFIVPTEQKFHSLTGEEAWIFLESRSSPLGDGILHEWWQMLLQHGGAEL